MQSRGQDAMLARSRVVGSNRAASTQSASTQGSKAAQPFRRFATPSYFFEVAAAACLWKAVLASSQLSPQRSIT